MDMDVKKIISEVRRDVTAEEREVADLEVMMEM